METGKIKEKLEKINANRRTVLKWLIFGAGAFALGKIFGPYVGLSRPQELNGKSAFKNFKVVETNKELRLYNRMGDEIFIIEKEGFTDNQ
ncbi:MAG: hypothetical protein AAB727_02275 [Patescibacteria group bacterium]